MTKLLIALAVAALGVSPQAHAYPELARHSYVNCTSCHVSPSGGGVLTAYGRQLASDLLSTTAREGESDFVYGAIKSPEWLNLGGDYRAVDIHRDTPQVTAYRFLFMQADVEGAATYGKFTADLRAGIYMQLQGLQSRQFYVNYRPTDALSFRAGKFQQAYGLMEADHTTPIRRGLGWDEGTETYNVEAAWLGDNLNAYLTGNFGPLDSALIADSSKEHGVAARLGVPFADRYQVGASYFHGISPTWNRDVTGPFAILGLSHRLFLLSELDVQSTHTAGSADSTGWVTWNKLDYEVIQGLHGYLICELTRPDFKNSSTQSSSWGFGSQFFPRPHFELDLLWQFQSVPTFPSSTLDYATLLLHFYL